MAVILPTLEIDQNTAGELSDYELRVGAVGHRDLRCRPEAELADAIQNLLQRIVRTLRANHSTPLRWIVFSPLAKGADRIIARTAMDAVQAKLFVVTPFPVDEYRRDFEASADAEEFEELWERKTDQKELPAPREAPPENDRGSLALDHRRKGYLRVGQEIVDSVEILIAIWDGKPAGGMGGTGEVVDYALAQGRFVIGLDPTDPTLEPAVLQRAEQSGNHEGAVQKVPLPQDARQLSAGYVNLDEYQSDPTVKHAAQLDGEVRQASERLIRQGSAGQISERSLARSIQGVLPQFCNADLMANRYHSKYIWANVMLFALSAFAVTFGTMQHFLRVPMWGGFEVLSLLGVIIWLYRSRKKGWHQKWLRARFFAEYLRASLFTVLRSENQTTGNDESPLPYYCGPGEWMLNYCRSVLQRARELAGPTEPEKIVQDFIKSAWIDDQLAWHQKNVERQELHYNRLELGGKILFAATLFVATVHFVHSLFEPGATGEPKRFEGWLTFFAIILPAWASAVHAINLQLEWQRIAARSRGMAKMLSKASDQYRAAHNNADRWHIIRDTERLVRHELIEWWVLISFREFPLPA